MHEDDSRNYFAWTLDRMFKRYRLTHALDLRKAGFALIFEDLPPCAWDRPEEPNHPPL